MDWLIEIKHDDYISKKIVDNIGIFRYIHPNQITIFGILMNIVSIYYLFFLPDLNNYGISFSMILFFRWLADCLDGNVARKYNKTSKLGNILDTCSDMMMMIIYYFYLFTRIQNNIFASFLTVVYSFIGYFMIYENRIFESHSLIKKEGGKIKNFVVFLINNTYILFVLYFMSVIYFV
jgi:phosphatidylglycerophosphate synthase